MERDQSRHAGPASGPFWAHAVWLELTAALDWLPLAALVLTPDGTALAANEAWAKLSEAPAEAARGDGWLRVVVPPDRGPLRALLRQAPPGETGWGDFRLAGPVRERWSRWRWLPGPAGRLIVCVADLDERPQHDGRRHLNTRAHLAAYPPRPDQRAERPVPTPGPAPAPAASLNARLNLAETTVHRLFGVGLILQSVAGQAHGAVAERLKRAADELDDVIRDVRTAVFETRRPEHPQA